MLNQPATLNEPVETWLRRRIREYERRARAARSGRDGAENRDSTLLTLRAIASITHRQMG